MFAYCTEVLHLSEHEAYLRIKVARHSREHPMLLEMLAEGRLPLSAIARLAPHLTKSNREAVLARATGRSKRQIEELIAELSPRPDVPATIRKLPERRPKIDAKTRPDQTQLVPELVTFLHTPPPAAPKPTPQRPVVQPLAPARYKIQFTASAELYDKLERLRALMRSSVPDGDLAAIIETAVTEKLERLEAKRFGQTKAPRKNVGQIDTSPTSRYIPAPVKRAVRERDGNRCAFVSRDGRRCTRRDDLEFHHRDPFARGGDHRPENIQLMCKAHNTYFAELEYGKGKMKRYRPRPDRVSEPLAVYSVCSYRRRTRLRIEPTFSTSHTHSSPSLRKTGGLREKPTPNGVPVGMRSPGRSVVPSEV